MLKHILKHSIYLIPPILLAERFISSFFDYGITAYSVAANIGGYSILTNLVFIYVFFFTRRYCLFTKLCVVGLVILNILCLLGNFINYNSYSYIYTSTTTAIVLIMWMFYTIRDK